VTERTPARRGHTRWLMIVPLVSLAAIIAGVVALEAVAPQLDPEVVASMAIEDIPPVAVEEAPQCTRGGLDDTTIRDLRDQISPGGRVASEQVYRCPAAWDGADVTYVGEAVGEVLRRDGGAWVQINDDPYALESGPLVGHRELAGSNSGVSVWLPDGLHERIEEVGRPAQRGDVVLLRGRLLRADPDDGGGITIRAEELEVVAPSTGVEEPLHVAQLVVAVLLVAIALSALLWARRRRQL
jgi:hypothetical protein